MSAESSPPSDDARELRAMRERMDGLNDRLCALLQDRTRLARRIAAWKRARGMAVADAARERAMLDRVAAAAAGDAFDAAALRRLFEMLFAETRARLERDRG